MSATKWTTEQQQAIEAQGGTLLLSAAAGSGKTAVLVERVLRMITDPVYPVELTQLLIVTFSNAAAAEMRQRIGKRLTELMQEQPENMVLQKQLTLLGNAPIQTVHAFCMNLIREHFQELGLPPDFAIMDEKELDLLKNDTALECMEYYYESAESEHFYTLVELLSQGRDDTKFLNTVIKLYDFARSHPFYEEWLDQKLELYHIGQPVLESRWGKTICAYGMETLRYCIAELTQVIQRDLLPDEELSAAYLPAIESDIAQLQGVLAYLETHQWDAAVAALRNYKAERLKAVKGNDSIKEHVKQVRARCKEMREDLAKKYFVTTQQEFEEDVEVLRPQIEVLFDLVKRFGQTLADKKVAQKKLDFSDLEHYALQLLVEIDGERHIPSAYAQELRTQYASILVDEYQDTNEVQDLLFQSLSNGHNLFMVGDVKQSIYAFRMAMPELFMEKKKQFAAYSPEETEYPATIQLDANFRSRSEVTGAINYLFTLLMSEENGGVVYNTQEILKCATDYPENSMVQPELLLLDGKNYEGEKTALEREANLVAKHIYTMLNEAYQVYDHGHYRNVEPGDFCILLRSPKNRAEAYILALEEYGIAGSSDYHGAFLATREISLMVSLLAVLDNPLLDIELAAVLLSPFIAFSEDELAFVRLQQREQALYFGLLAYADAGNEKAQQIVALFQRLRYYAASHTVHDLLLEVYRETHWLELAAAMPLGERREANLFLLVEHAAYYHKMGYRGLSAFVGLLRRMQEQGTDLESAAGVSGVQNAVQILSIHRSKGLEFPVVILADTTKTFNKRDLQDIILLHSDLGFACMRREPESRAQFLTLPLAAARLEAQKSLLSEEMRVLYVALTRAKEKLIITGVSRKIISDWMAELDAPVEDGILPPFLVGEQLSYADWIAMALLHHPSADVLRESLPFGVATVPNETAWNILLPMEEENKKPLDILAISRAAQSEPNLRRQIEQRTHFVYPYLIETQIPTKLSVSELVHEKHAAQHRFRRRPRVLEREALTASERGNALHKFMQFANYQAAKKDVEAEISRMCSEEYLTSTEADSLPRDQIAVFFASYLAERMFASPRIIRELRFVSEFGAEDLPTYWKGDITGGKIIVQGVADCVFYEKDYAVLVDYKTDKVSSMKALVEHYQDQITLYQKILTQTLQVPIKEGILYSLTLGEACNVLALEYTEC